MDKMNKHEKINMMIKVGGLLLIILTFTVRVVIFPYVAVIKVERGELKTTCAYVVGTQKDKHSNNTIIKINNDYYTDLDILPLQNKSLFLKREEWLKFPLGNDFEEFLLVLPDVCKKVKYVEVYNIFNFKKIYLYEYIKN